METAGPSIVAIIVMALIYMGIGWYWYSPKLFGNMIVCPSKVEGKENECKECCWMSYGGEFVLALIMGYVMASFAIAMNSDSIWSGIKLGFWAWLGFVATTQFTKILWAHRPLINFYICGGFYLIMLVLMGAVFSVWR